MLSDRMNLELRPKDVGQLRFLWSSILDRLGGLYPGYLSLGNIELFCLLASISFFL